MRFYKRCGGFFISLIGNIPLTKTKMTLIDFFLIVCFIALYVHFIALCSPCLGGGAVR